MAKHHFWPLFRPFYLAMLQLSSMSSSSISGRGRGRGRGSGRLGGSSSNSIVAGGRQPPGIPNYQVQKLLDVIESVQQINR